MVWKLPKGFCLFISGVLLFMAGNVAVSGPRMEPLFTRYAQIYSAPTLDANVEYFKDTPMEEVDDFDGYTVTLDFTYPINEMSQVEVLAPLYTNGDATYRNPGEPGDGESVDIEGDAGVFDFFSVIYERRSPWLEQTLGANVAYRVGAGKRFASLDVELDGEVIDKFNHNGYNFLLGLKMDDEIRDGSMTVLGNADYILFRDTDDLNLSGDSVNFEMLRLNGAVIFNNYSDRLKPVVEVLFEYDFEDYSALILAPEVLYSISDGWDVKFGVPFRVTSDGEKVAARLELTHRF